MLNKRRPIAASLALLAMTITSGAFAASPRQELEQTKKDIETEKERQSVTQEEADKLKTELRPMQEKLVKAAEATQKTEAEFSDTEEKLRILTEQVKTKNETLKVQRQHLSALIMAELSLSTTPPEAMLMMPQDPLEIMKAARALNMASDSIRREAQSIRQQLSELNTLKSKVSEHRDELADLAIKLEKERTELSHQLAERTSLLKKLGQQQKQGEATLARLAKRSSDLQDLVTGIEKEEIKKEAEEAKRAAAAEGHTDRKHLRSFVEAKGQIRPPAAGSLVQKFGATQGKNATSKGVTIATRGGARVTAPYDGEVVFTGPFLGYGQMIILRHSDDFHTLLAGLSKIDVEVGQFLLEGEPIGAMGDSNSETRTEHTLYIELRKDNQPVDPAQWINGLNKKK